MNLNCARRGSPIFHQMQEVLSNLFWTRLIRRLACEFRKSSDGIEVALNREIGVIAELEILHHPLS